MRNERKIFPLEESQIEAAGAAMARAFFIDTIMEYMFPDEGERRRLAPWHFSAHIRYGYLFGEVYTTSESPDGTSVWFRPGESELTAKRIEQAGIDRAPLVLGAAAWARFSCVCDYVESLHPREVPEPHWYLPLLGVTYKPVGRFMNRLRMSKGKVTSEFALVLFIAVGSLLIGPARFPSLAQGHTATPGPYIPPACVGKPITKMSRAAMLAQAVSEAKPNSPITQSDQLTVFNALAKVIDESYLYPDFKGLDWPSVVAEFRGKVEGGLDTENFYTEMEQFVRRLGDKHSSFESPVKAAALKAQLAGQNNYVGVGALFQSLVETKRVSVLAVIPDSPAEHGGLRQHDIVLEVDGLPLVENERVYPHTRGPECSAATLTLKSPGKAPRNVTVVRARVTSPMPVYARLVPTADDRRVGYIFLPTFLDLTIPGQVKKALEDFGPLDGLVLDNRMNGGGSSQALIQMLGYFTSGTLGHFVSRTARRPLEIVAAPINNSQKLPLVILVSKNTVSYGEVFAGALRDIGRAKVVGQTTAGRVETLHGYTFADGSKAWIAKERFDPIRSHTDWQGIGVQPDVEAHALWDEFTFENDPALVVALKLLPR